MSEEEAAVKTESVGSEEGIPGAATDAGAALAAGITAAAEAEDATGASSGAVGADAPANVPAHAEGNASCLRPAGMQFGGGTQLESVVESPLSPDAEASVVGGTDTHQSSSSTEQTPAPAASPKSPEGVAAQEGEDEEVGPSFLSFLPSFSLLASSCLSLSPPPLPPSLPCFVLSPLSEDT